MIKKKSDKHINWLDFGIFFGSTMFIVGFTFEEALSHLKKKKSGDWILALESTTDLWKNENWGFVSKRTLVTGKIYYFLVLKKQFDFQDESHAKLAHEILHLCSFHLKDFLDPIEENECFCYTHTHLMTQCYKILRS